MPTDSGRDIPFDQQATDFDVRAGLPAGVAARVADAIIGIAPLAPGVHVLEIGAGTGEIGSEIVARWSMYTALDLSPQMLAVFRRKTNVASLTAELVVGDARERWPVPNASVGLVFGSRSMHWLDPEHVRDEALRVGAPGGCTVLIGRVERPDANPRARMRRRMRELLRDAGYAGRSGGASTLAIVRGLIATGAAHVPVRVAARWSVWVTPRAVLDAWRMKSGLGGVDLAPEAKERVLAQTQTWAVETFGDIDLPTESEECYTLEGAMLVPSGSPIR